MKNTIYILIIIIILSIFVSALPLYASDSNEVPLAILFRNYQELTKEIIPNMAVEDVPENGHIAIDYSVEILKKFPNSLEAFYTIVFFSNISLGENNVKEKYKILKDIHLSNLSDLEFKPYEKLIFLLLLLRNAERAGIDEAKTNYDLAWSTLINMKGSKNTNYAALANIIMILEQGRLEDINYFMESFSSHVAIPLVDLEKNADYFVNGEYQKYVTEVKTMSEKYKNINTPWGWKIIIDYYSGLIFGYCELNDYENAKNYLSTIEKEAPDYWKLDILRLKLQEISNNKIKR